MFKNSYKSEHFHYFPILSQENNYACQNLFRLRIRRRPKEGREVERGDMPEGNRRVAGSILPPSNQGNINKGNPISLFSPLFYNQSHEIPRESQHCHNLMIRKD